MGRIRNAAAWGISAAAFASCAVAVAGCGGGGDDATSTAAGVTTAPEITSPAGLGPGAISTPTSPNGPGTSGTPGPNAAPGAPPLGQALSPFRSCLRQHGVDPPPLGDSEALRRAYQQDPERFRSQVERGFACIPELPPRMRAYAERFRHRFEQRTQG